MPNMTTLGQIAPCTTQLAVACMRCGRSGRLSMKRLLAEHGPRHPCIEVFRALEANCVRRDEALISDRCFVHSPDLDALVRG